MPPPGTSGVACRSSLTSASLECTRPRYFICPIGVTVFTMNTSIAEALLSITVLIVPFAVPQSQVRRLTMSRLDVVAPSFPHTGVGRAFLRRSTLS